VAVVLPSTAGAGQGTPDKGATQAEAPGPPQEQEKLQGVPKGFELMQNFPNPFTPHTTIRYALPERSEVSIKIFTILGQEVATLVSGTVEAGYRAIEWKAVDRSGRALPPGIYLYRMQANALKSGEYHQVRRMILLK